MYAKFERNQLSLKPLSERISDMSRDEIINPEATSDYNHKTMPIIAERMRSARAKRASVLLMIGAHAIKTGLSQTIIKLMQNGHITHLAMNGAGCIHDYELALCGETTESVARYISEGQFGLWRETGRINDIAKEAQEEDIGLGEAVGRTIAVEKPPYEDISVLAWAYKLGIPSTVHVGIGCDIIHEHPNCDGAALGAASYNDFLVYTQTISNLEGGVFLNFGSAVFGPEVYLKALAMARNAAHGRGERIANFTTAVFDLLPLEDEDIHETPPKTDMRYYFRPWKTILARTVADGGESYYIQGEHKDTLPYLYRLMQNPAAL